MQRDRRKGGKRLDRALETLTARQRDLLLELLDGRRALLQVEGSQYAVRFGDTWSFVRLDTCDEHACTLLACSCPDNRFRQHECKHMRAMRKLCS